MKSMTAAAARILRVVFDHPNNTVDLVYSQASSIVISLANEAMIAISTRGGNSGVNRGSAGSIVSRLAEVRNGA